MENLTQLKTAVADCLTRDGVFKASVQKKEQEAKAPHRLQNRLTEKFSEKIVISWEICYI